MVNKRFWLGILVMVLVFGITVVGCSEEDGTKKVPYPQAIDIFVDYPSWTGTSGFANIRFQPIATAYSSGTTYTGTPASVSPTDLNWLSASDINLTPADENTRTLTKGTIEKTANGDGTVVKLNLTRSAEPSPITNYNTVTVSISLPPAFSAKYPDGINWASVTIQF